MPSTASPAETERLAAAPERRRAHRQHVAELRGEMACPSTGPFRRGPPRDRSQGERLTAACRLRARGHRPGHSSQRRQRAPGLHVTRLCAEELFPVCSPKLLQGRNPLRKPSDLGRVSSCTSTAGRIGIEWLDFAGVKNLDLSRGPVLNQASMAIDAAVDGQGVALARTALAAWDLINGRLVCPFDIAMPVSYAYWIVCPKAAAKLPKIVAFSEWLLAEAAEDARQLEHLKSKSRGAGRAPAWQLPSRRPSSPGAGFGPALSARHPAPRSRITPGPQSTATARLGAAHAEGMSPRPSASLTARSCETPLDLDCRRTGDRRQGLHAMRQRWLAASWRSAGLCRCRAGRAARPVSRRISCEDRVCIVQGPYHFSCSCACGTREMSLAEPSK